MGRMNPGYKTLMQRHGFADTDLKTPAHDHILFWLKGNMLAVLERLYPLPAWADADIEERRTAAKARIVKQIEGLQKVVERNREITGRWNSSTYPFERERVEKLKAETDASIAEIERLQSLVVLSGPPPPPSIELVRVTDECPLGTNDRANIIVGYVDCIAECYVPIRIADGGGRLDRDLDRSPKNWRDPHWSVERQRHVTAFEIKTTIPSYGELMRQLNTYRRYFAGDIVVLSPEDRFADAIREQRFGFVKFEGELPTSGPQQHALI